MDDGLYVNSVWYSCKINKMKDNIKTMARQMARMSSSDLRELESALMQNGISATIYRVSPVTSVWDDKPETCALYLRRTGDRKLQLVKSIKEIFGWGLREAKSLVDDAPCFIKKNIPREEAEAIKNELNEIGAYVVIKDNNYND